MTLSHRTRSAHRRPAPSRWRPQLEVLEDRTTPAMLTVNTLADASVADSALSLREAIAAVNSRSTAGLSAAEAAQVSGSLGSNDTIAFSVSGTITLQAALPSLSAGVAIQGPGAAQLAVSGADQFRVLSEPESDYPFATGTSNEVRVRER